MNAKQLRAAAGQTLLVDCECDWYQAKANSALSGVTP